MKKIIINNSILSKFVNLSEDFNIITFLYLYKDINNNFKVDVDNDKFKFFLKEKDNIVIKNLPEIEIDTPEKLYSFFRKISFSDQQTFSNIFKSEYDVDLFDEIQDIFLKDIENNTINKNFVVSFVSFSINNPTLIYKHKNAIKSFLESDLSKSSPTLYIEILLNLIDNRDVLGTDFVIEKLNYFFDNIFIEGNKYPGSLHYNLDLISKKVIFLDYSKVKLKPKLENFLKELIPLTEISNENCFFWKINTAYFSYIHKIQENILKTNVNTALNTLKETIQDEFGVFSFNLNFNKSHLSVSVIHKNLDVENALKSSLDYVLKTSLDNNIISNETIQQIILNSLIKNKNIIKNVKNKI